jgi:hypothetical protein
MATTQVCATHDATFIPAFFLLGPNGKPLDQDRSHSGRLLQESGGLAQELHYRSRIKGRIL